MLQARGQQRTQNERGTLCLVRPDVIVYLYEYCLLWRAVEDWDRLGVDLVVQQEETGWEALGKRYGRLQLTGVRTAVWRCGGG